MSKNKQIVAWMSLMVLLTPIATYAHVKWFTVVTPQKEALEVIVSPFFISIALLAASILAILTQLLPLIENISFLKKIDQKLAKYRRVSRYLLKYGTAVALLIQVLTGTVLAPEFSIPTTTIRILMWLTIILLAIPIHYATKAGAIVLIIIFFSILDDVGLFHMLDYGYYLAIAGVLLIGKTRIEDWGFPFLYLGTGLSLCWVAVEKWVYPILSVDIIHQHHVPTFGFDPETFIVLAAFIEFVVGYLLVVGVLNRILAFVLTIIFIMTTMLFGWAEVVGHFMIHVVLIIFIIEGVSFYHPPISIHRTMLDQMVFVFLNFIFVLATFLLIYYRFA